MVINNKVGLVLSGGGFKALAQLGVLHYMYELKVPIDMISGTSAGALIGAFLAHGFSPYQILQLAKTEKIFSYSHFSLRKGGLFSSVMIEDIVKKYIPHNSFGGLKKELFATVTDLTNGRELTFNQGELGAIIKASCSFPVIFSPVMHQGLLLCDGGIFNNFPVEPLSGACGSIIGINVNPITKIEGNLSYKQLMNRIIRLTSSQLGPLSKSQCTVFIEPEGINDFTMFEAQKLNQLFELGYKASVAYKKDFLAIKDKVHSNNLLS